jgi:hypothetical protein
MKNCLEASLRKQDSIVPRTWSPYPLGPIRGMIACYFKLEAPLLQYDPRQANLSDKAVGLYEVPTAPFFSIQRDCPQQHHS